MPPQNLTLSFLTPDEAPLYVAIRHVTFRDTVNKILYAHEPSENTLKEVENSIKEAILDGSILYLKVVDDKTGQMIAGARWRLLGPKDFKPVLKGEESKPNETAKRVRDRTLEEVDAALSTPKPYVESDPRVWNGLFTLFNANKREIMGTKSFLVLDTLVTHPSHHRRGAGGMLIQWGCNRADELGVECYLEASPMGVPLYERYGFRRVKEIVLDLRQFGGDMVFTFAVMVRPAKGNLV